MSISGIRIPRSELECSICLEVFVKPLMMKCQHVFCTACIQQVPTSTCPLCNRTFKKEKLVVPLFLNRILECTRPGKTFVKFDEDAADLLLKLNLVDSREELFLLDAVLETGLLDYTAETAVDKFSERSEEAIKRLIASKNHSELNLLFEAIFELACSDREKKVLFIPSLLKLLDYTKHSLKRRIMSKGSLDFLTVTLGFNALQKFLPFRNADRHPTAFEILESLIGLSNHPEFPLDLKKSLLVLIVQYSQNDLQRFILLAKSAAIAHSPPGSIQEMTKALHSALIVGRLSTSDQMEILGNQDLKHILLKLNPEENVVSDIVSALLQCVKTVHDTPSINYRAIQLLKIWIAQEHKHNEVNIFTRRQKQTFDALIILAKTHSEYAIQLAILSELYNLFEETIPPQSCYTTFFNTFLSLLNDDQLNLSLRLILAEAIPIGNLPLQGPPATMLFQMMLEKIQHPEYPVELTKIYIWKMMQISSNCKQIFFIGGRQSSNVLDLEVIQNNPEYLQIARESRR